MWNKDFLEKKAKALQREIITRRFSDPARAVEVTAWTAVKGKERIYINLRDSRGERCGTIFIEKTNDRERAYLLFGSTSYNTMFELKRAIKKVLLEGGVE